MERIKEVLVDSDIMIDHLRAFRSINSISQFAGTDIILYLSVVSLTEIYSGKDTKSPSKLREVENLLANFEVALITTNIARRAGELRRDYQGPFADMLIAATALEYHWPLATRNIRHFQGLSKLEFFKMD